MNLANGFEPANLFERAQAGPFQMHPFSFRSTLVRAGGLLIQSVAVCLPTNRGAEISRARDVSRGS